MAVDQALLASANESGQVILRFYRWSPATLSLGYFQSADQRRQHQPSLSCDLVRRVSGGGAILHDRELTYSLCVPRKNRFSTEHEQLYRQMHDAIIDSLRDWAVAASLYADRENAPASLRFLCFQRRSLGDVVVKGAKICGSAQRRANGAILQHGSIVWARSEFAPEVEGVREVAGVEIPEASFIFRLVECLSQSWQLDFVPSQLREREQFTTLEIQQKQFVQHDWNYRR